MQDKEAHGKPIEELVSGLQTHLEHGLTRAEAEALINEHFEEYTDSDVVDVYIYPKYKAPKQQQTDFEDLPF